MTERMKQRLADLKESQERGEHTMCPRCGQDTMKPALHTNALSRHLEGVYICDSCGVAEAMLDYMQQSLPISLWAICRPLRTPSGFKSMSP